MSADNTRALQGRRILLVEDDVLLTEPLLAFLSYCGADVHLKTSIEGPIALYSKSRPSITSETGGETAAPAAEPKNPYDVTSYELIIMDMRLPRTAADADRISELRDEYKKAHQALQSAITGQDADCEADARAHLEQLQGECNDRLQADGGLQLLHGLFEKTHNAKFRQCSS